MHALARQLLADPLPGVTDIVPSYATLYLEYDRGLLSESAVRAWAERHEQQTAPAVNRVVTVPVRYDGVDLAVIADEAGVEVAEVIARHAGVDYRVYALGFTGGFPFLGEVDPVIRSPRLEVPRERVEANSVAIADAQGGIYPLAAPGGWKLLGTALKAVYDPHRDEPFLLEAGDTVRFVPAEGDAPVAVGALELLPLEPRRPVLKVLEPGLLDLVVDEGRFMVGRFGLARSGPIDGRSAALANSLLANPVDAPVLELNVVGPVLEVLAPTVVAFAGWGVEPRKNGEHQEPFSSFSLTPGDVLSFPPAEQGVRGYLAVAGGIESGAFLGSASVDVRGLIGRPLLQADLLGSAEQRRPLPGFSFRPHMRWSGAARIRILPGPQATDAALRALTSDAFRVRHSDRMGLRLEGPEVPGGGVLSEANPLGAVQVTTSGMPLVLLHDRGTIGGYEKPAIVHPKDLPRLAQLRAGGEVVFELTT